MSIQENTTALRSLLDMAYALPEAGSGGANVQKKTGAFTTDSNGEATIDVGFKPDLIAINGGYDVSGILNYCGSMFTEANQEQISTLIAPEDKENYLFTQTLMLRTTTGAKIGLYKVSTSFQASPETNRTIEYTAIKYT